MSQPTFEIVLYAGPSLSESARQLCRGVHVRPPIARGDLPRLLAAWTHPPAALAIADGVFWQSLSVGHAEIRDALWRGWQVWGLCSMGAIRAAEMRPHGVLGFGRVYDLFATDPDFRDDEVALLHTREFPYRLYSEPMVHLREAIRHWRRVGMLSDADEKSLVLQLSEMWYGDRTIAHLQELLADLVGVDRAHVLNADLETFDRFRVKQIDMDLFLEQRPWRKTI